MTLDDFADMLGRLRDEVWDDRSLLIALHDNVLTTEATDSFDRAAGIPVKESTAERRRRGRRTISELREWRSYVNSKGEVGRRLARTGQYGKEKHQRRAYGERKKRSKAPLDLSFRGAEHSVGTIHGHGAGMRAAFTDEAYEKNPAKLFDIRHGGLIFGTKRWLTWSSYHMQITAPSGTKFMPARIDFATGASRDTIEEGIKMETESWIFERMARAGAPEDWLSDKLPAGA